MTGAELLCRRLEALGADTVFGLPGSQTVTLFEALRTSRLRTVVGTHELAASFMANGYARASGRPGVFATIPGPGFTYALTGLAEALLDSTPVLYILGGPATGPGRRFQLQALDQRAVAAPLAKKFFDVEAADQLERSVCEAFLLCQAGEPGPVVVQVPPRLLAAEASTAAPSDVPSSSPATPPLDELERRLIGARRPLLYVGQGVFGSERELRRLAELTRAPVATTTSARGVIPEDHPWVLRCDRRNTDTLNDLVAAADLVLALGVKFSHNGAHGFRLILPAERLIHVDASREVLGANYETSLAYAADVPMVVRSLAATVSTPGVSGSSEWTEDEVASWNDRAVRATRAGAEPIIRDVEPATMPGFFEALRRAMPPDSCLVLDSGLHQMLARRHFRSLCPRGLILPTDLQSMGFALPAAIGAKLARPDRPVVALLGDGGFAISGLELLTAIQCRLALTVIVFNDGHYGLIHRQQIGTYGHAHGTVLRNPDIRGIAESAGARYLALAGDAARSIAEAVRGEGVTVIEVALRDPGRRLQRVTASFASRLSRWLAAKNPLR